MGDLHADDKTVLILVNCVWPGIDKIRTEAIVGLL
jgi:hypothetical protein